MGCGTSANVIPLEANGGTSNGIKAPRDDETSSAGPEGRRSQTPPIKPPLAFEIPIEEPGDDGTKKQLPPRIQKLMEQPPPDITLPDIEEKLAEAESRRQMILQQRVLSASKRTQKALRMLSDNMNEDSETIDNETRKDGATDALKPPADTGIIDDRTI